MFRGILTTEDSDAFEGKKNSNQEIFDHLGGINYVHVTVIICIM